MYLSIYIYIYICILYLYVYVCVCRKKVIENISASQVRPLFLPPSKSPFLPRSVTLSAPLSPSSCPSMSLFLPLSFPLSAPHFAPLCSPLNPSLLPSMFWRQSLFTAWHECVKLTHVDSGICV